MLVGVQKEPIAVVGMSCRFPNGLNDLRVLWQKLQNRFNAIRETPEERWSADRYYSNIEASRGKAYVRRGGYIDQSPREFDANFFGISPRDAENMDPQQRLMLEVTWEALENAGLKAPELAGRPIGVYVGGFMLDHMITQMSHPNRSQINQYSAAGMMMTMLSNRVSHVFDFRGPSLSIDTACSSSLVAFNYACQDVWSSACEMAVVGGVNVMTRPEYPMGMCKGQFLARDGECKSFDARGDGYGRAEGAGIVLLKPLSKALADGNDVWATVIASGTNQDGHTPGISMPSGEAQLQLIQQVCEKYNVDPKTIQYVECHGTGTAIGDPTEASSIGKCYGNGRSGDDRVIVGSIKSNVGHMEACAGVAGVIKAVLTLHHGETSPLGNLQTPNPNIPFEELGIRLSDNCYKLNQKAGPVRVAVNSFGYGGSNAHAILEAYSYDGSAVPTQASHGKGAGNHDAELDTDCMVYLPISARSAQAAEHLGRSYASMLDSGVSLRDLVYSLTRRRTHLNCRAIVSGANELELLSNLRSWLDRDTTGSTPAENGTLDSVAVGQAPYGGGNPKPVFVFTGMGPQWWGMGQELYRDNPIYRSAVNEADDAFKRVAGFSALAEMQKSEEDSQIQKTEFAQPANLLIQIGLLAVLRSRGIEPAACVGHSVGELTAAYAAGVLTLDDVVQVCYHRSQQQARAKGIGSMLAVGISLETAQAMVAETDGRVSIAAINGATNITLAGDTEELERIAVELTEQNIFNRRLEVEVAYHSPTMDPLMEPLRQALVNIEPQLPAIPLYSTVTGARVTDIAYGANYWPQNIRQPVEFVDAIKSIIADGFSHFIEVGPHPVLATSIKECVQNSGKECRNFFTLRRKSAEAPLLDRLFLEFYAQGGEIQWEKRVTHGRIIDLPNYPWQRELHWLENPRATQDRINPIVNPILGTQEAPGTLAYRNDFDHCVVQYLRDHVVMGLSILPGAGCVEAMIELAAIHFPDAKALAIRNYEISTPLILKEDRATDFVTSFDPFESKAVCRSLENGKLGPGQVHAIGELAALPVGARHDQTRVQFAELQSSFSQPLDISSFYGQLHRIGLQYGPAFQTVRDLWVADDRQQTLARIALGEDQLLHFDKYKVHPALLDGCFQTLMAMIDTSSATYLPTAIEEIRLYVGSLPSEIWCHGQLQQINDRFVECHLTLYDSDGNIVANVRRLRANAAPHQERVDQWGEVVKLQLLKYIWNEGERLPEPRRLGNWLVVADEIGMSDLIYQQLENFGARVAAYVQIGTEFSADGNRYSVIGESSQDWQRVVEHCEELDGVVIANSLNAWLMSDDPTGERQLRTVVAMLQGLFRAGLPEIPRLYLLTQSAFCVVPSDNEVNPAQASFNGFARVAFNELESGRFTSIDLPSAIDETTFEALIQELICDAPQDEIALRQGQRFTSELTLTDDLTKDNSRVAYCDDQHPIVLRPNLSESDVGTARVLADTFQPLSSDAVRIRIEKGMIPIQFLNGESDNLIERPTMEFVGRIVELGSGINDLECGVRVCGFGPAEAGSHLVDKRSNFALTVIAEDDDAYTLLSQISNACRVAAVANQLGDGHGQIVVVELSSLGIELANELTRRGAEVILLADSEEAIAAENILDYPCFVTDAEQLDQCMRKHTGDRGFDIMAVNAARWNRTWGWMHLARGGVIVDTDSENSSFSIPLKATKILRTSVDVLSRIPSQFAVALENGVGMIRTGKTVGANSLEIPVSDIAWQKLPLNVSLENLIVSMETDNVDLPVVQQDYYQFAPGSTYLITGGLGGFGQQTARWLVENGVSAVVLTGRRGADTDEKRAFVAELEKTGAIVKAIACDCADPVQVRQLLEMIANELPPLRGIVHSAAAIIDQPIAEIELGDLSTVMRNKATVAWVLHEETRELTLDHFILYSSAANLVGNSRQSIYSAANGFLNGLAHMRRQMGLAGTSINWGAISDVGIVARDEKLEQFLRYVGLRGMESSEALSLLKTCLSRDLVQFGATVIKSWADWGRFEIRAGQSPRYQKLIASDASGQDTEARSALIAELSALEPEEQLEVLAVLITDVLAAILKTDASQIPRSKPINELGVDSPWRRRSKWHAGRTGAESCSVRDPHDSTIQSLAKSSYGSLGLAGVSATVG
ncbi:MAG: SDR family NAD(P)-dependent oxidoreductase [Pirellulaceae bacterium]